MRERGDVESTHACLWTLNTILEVAAFSTAHLGRMHQATCRSQKHAEHVGFTNMSLEWTDGAIGMYNTKSLLSFLSSTAVEPEVFTTSRTSFTAMNAPYERQVAPGRRTDYL